MINIILLIIKSMQFTVSYVSLFLISIMMMRIKIAYKFAPYFKIATLTHAHGNIQAKIFNGFTVIYIDCSCNYRHPMWNYLITIFCDWYYQIRVNCNEFHKLMSKNKHEKSYDSNENNWTISWDYGTSNAHAQPSSGARCLIWSDLSSTSMLHVCE